MNALLWTQCLSVADLPENAMAGHYQRRLGCVFHGHKLLACFQLLTSPQKNTRKSERVAGMARSALHRRSTRHESSCVEELSNNSLKHKAPHNVAFLRFVFLDPRNVHECTKLAFQ